MNWNELVTAAVADILEHGYDSPERIALWAERIKAMALRQLPPVAEMRRAMDQALASIYRRLVDRGGITAAHVGLADRFTVERLRPHLRAALDRRIMASADLITLNRQVSIQKTLQRFQGWATSIPAGGSDAASRQAAKATIKKAMASLPYEDRRVIIDQGHKLRAALSEIIAVDGQAIAAMWHSHWRQRGYNYREDHKERDERVYLVRGSWAQQRGYVKPGEDGYTDDITKPGEEIFCFPGWSKVPFAGRAVKGYRRWYSGQLTKFVTTSGEAVDATPNHPVLTSRGWRPAYSINVGDDVVEITDKGWKTLAEEDQDHRVPTIAEIYRTLSEFGVHKTAKLGGADFHGDGAVNGDVDVVCVDRALLIDRVSKCPQGVGDGLFAQTYARSAFGHGVGALNHGLQAVPSAAHCGMGFGDQALATVDPFPGHPYEVGFGSVTQRDANMLGQETAGNLQALRQAKQALPFEVSFARVVAVECRDWSGHVYNLETDRGLYSINSVIVHNCRCYYQWYYNVRDLPDDMVTAKGREALAAARATIAAA